uniref:Uncharacterized protein n=1 Tax=Anguilla anguilla TaxID=7936 RepID=A0A0E9WAJ8_ANGAN
MIISSRSFVKGLVFQVSCNCVQLHQGISLPNFLRR